MRITSDVNSVLGQITGKENFIAIGELHNSRSAIKFMMDNIDKLIPDKRKTYFLTEFFPTGLELSPNNKNQNNFLKAKLGLTDKGKQLQQDLTIRENSRSSSEKIYNLSELYKKIFPKVAAIKSIEFQNEGSKELNEKIKQGNLDAYETRTNTVNRVALSIADEIWKKEPEARIIIFAGMGHVANSTVRKFDKATDHFLEERKLSGINNLLKGITLKESKASGLTISIHDPELCINKDSLKELKASNFTKYAQADDCVTIDEPDILLFLTTPSTGEKKILPQFESIFLPGEHSISEMKAELNPSKTSTTSKG